MTFEPSPDVPNVPQPPLAPPEETFGWVKAIFWNEREFRAGWRLMAFLLLFGISIGAATLLTIALHLPHMTRSGMTPGGLFLQEGLGVLAVLAAAAIMGQMEGRPFGVYGLPVSEAFGARFWQGAAWGIAMITATILLIRLFGGFSFGDLALHGIELWRYAILWGLGFVCVGLFEEFLFRGYAQYTLSTGIPFWRAATLLSAGFGAIHLSNAGEDKIGALSVFVIAMFFCFTLRRTGNLWFAVGLHAAFDWGETFLFSVPDSGIVASGHMLNSSFHGPAWLTGGTVGPEGSMMVFVVVGLTAIIFSRVYPEREEN